MNQKEAAQKKLWHLSCQTYACKKDAEKAFRQVEKSLRYYQATPTYVEKQKHNKVGRPKKGEVSTCVTYKIEFELELNEELVTLVRRQKGRFIIATNQLDVTSLSDIEMFEAYKNQSKTESGFRFIKHNSFEVSGIFLKNTTRISALMMVMTLCLMVYSVAQHHLREALKQAGDFIPNQLRKPSQIPTMKWVFTLFHGVQVLTLSLANGPPQTVVINLNHNLTKIIAYFGAHTSAIYGLSSV